jgi:hypothetical protein
MRLRYGENFAGTTQAIRYGESLNVTRRVKVTFHPGRPCARLGADRGQARKACASSRPATIRTCPIRPARLSSSCHATSSSPRRRSLCRCSGTAIRMTQIGKLLRSVALFPSARISSAPIRSARRSASSRFCASGTRRADYLHGAMEKHHRLLRQPRHRAWRTAPGAGRDQDRACRHHHALPAVGVERHLDAALSRSGHGFCFGLDAYPGPGAPAWRRRCRWSFPITPIGTASPRPLPRLAPAKSGSRTARRMRWCTGAPRAG